MPECYEVKRIANYLIDHDMIGSVIQSFEFVNLGERILQNEIPSQFIKKIKNQTITDIKTKAKYTFIQLDTHVIELHYRFTGIPHIEGAPYKDRLYSIFTLPIQSNTPEKHIRFKLITSKCICNYIDTRCLSSLKIHSTNKIEDTLTYKSLPKDLSQHPLLDTNKLNKTSKSIKEFLLDQTIAPSGIGNYLACEICSYATIYPNTAVSQLNSSTIHKINIAMEKIKIICDQSADYNWFTVFNKDKCSRCGCNISKQKFKKTAQTTHWCNHCQPP